MELIKEVLSEEGDDDKKDAPPPAGGGGGEDAPKKLKIKIPDDPFDDDEEVNEDKIRRLIRNLIKNK